MIEDVTATCFFPSRKKAEICVSNGLPLVSCFAVTLFCNISGLEKIKMEGEF